MKILFYLHHPAHFYLFKNSIKQLKALNYEITIIATKKDVLEDLLNAEGISYKNFLPKGRKDNKISIAIGLIKQDLKLLIECINNRPTLMIGTSTEICHIGFLLNIPSIFVNEDDVAVVPLVEKLAHPFARHLLAPDVCNTGIPSKTISYKGYHELAYLHPENFSPDLDIVKNYSIDISVPYFILRFAKLGAHHDAGIKGITDDIAKRVIQKLSGFGKIYITSERQLNNEFENYRLSISPIHMHHVLAFSDIFIGDSQTMSAEAGVLGVPFIRFNGFVGRIGYLNDLENNYRLGYGILPDNPTALLNTLDTILNMPNRKQIWEERRKVLLKEKIRVDSFITNLIANYPNNLSN